MLNFKPAQFTAVFLSRVHYLPTLWFALQVINDDGSVSLFHNFEF